MPGASVHNYECYRTYLRSVLVGRIKSNPNYSLRAFAKSLGCSPALLSRSLNGKKNLSNRISAQFAAKLGLVERERDYFCTLVRLNQAKSSLEIEYLREHLGSFNGQSESRHFDNEMFSIISDWHHIALLEMTDLDAKVDLIWAAKKLGITVAEAKDALDRLVRVGLLKPSGKGWKKTHSNSHCESPGLNRGLRTFHAQMLDQIHASLETQSNSEKFHSTKTFAINPSCLPEVDQILTKAMEAIEARCARSNTKTDVYHLSVSFINLTPSRESKK